MRIGVNCYRLQANIGGIKQYFINLFDWLLEFDRENEYVFFHDEHNLDELAKLKSSRWRASGKYLPERDLMEANLTGIDVYFCPFNTLWPRPVRVPSVVTLVDIQERYFPEFFAREDLRYRAWHYPGSTRAADRVVTISEFSKSSIEKFHNIPAAKLIVAHLCADPVYFRAEEIAEAPSRPVPFDRFLFYPANRWPHKNHDTLLKALRLLKDRGEPCNAVFTGVDVYGGYPLEERAREYGIREHVHSAGYVTVPQMAYLYRAAEMLVFPSLFEGFGMPLVEAMAAGCPVVAATDTCLPEICGAAAEFFDPARPEEIAGTILRVRRSADRRSDLIRLGKLRAGDFSAERLGRAHLRAFREAVSAYSGWRYYWHKNYYQPYHKWKVDKIHALNLPQVERLYSPWAKAICHQASRRALECLRSPFHWWRLLPRRLELRAIRESGLFDAAFYDRQASVAAGHSRAGDYLLRGWRLGYRPNPLFDGDWYLRSNPDVSAAGCNPLVHFIDAGANEHRDPHPLFDVSWYLEQYPDVARSQMNALRHYLEAGAAEGRNPHPLFDATYYLSLVRDYDAARPNPLAHYLSRVPAEAADPHPLFQGSWYLAGNADVAKTGMNPLVHYVLVGAKEGRSPNPAFDV